MALLCARTDVIRKLKTDNHEMIKGQIIDKLVAYTSEEVSFFFFFFFFFFWGGEGGGGVKKMWLQY